ncbi:50S ribosomal protein L11 methyltransferase [Clostridium sediminicola]|uniref:50S ribosomal protein L11 methyltransferase n=1 Tax=Clostridium sediminicola TaxID=3114879 RepID=UPI0031F24081
MNKDWIEVEIITSSEAVEAITAIIYETGVSGVSILDVNDIEFRKENKNYDEYFPKKLIDIEDGAIIRAYYKEENSFYEKYSFIKNKIESLNDYEIDTKETTIEKYNVNESQWENNWKKYYKPTKVGERIVVKPMWEDYSKEDGEIVLELDPGMAFGTGTHETTALCIRGLETYIDEEDIVFDIGTGSGILAIAASKLGAKKVVGVDLDPVAVEVAKENLELNLVQNAEILHGNLMEVVHGKADIVVANILADIIILLSKDVKEFIKQGGLFISSGIILDRLEEVKKILQDVGFDIANVEIMGEWCRIDARLN